MDEHVIGIFIHVVGALGFFVALGLEWTGLWQIRSARLPDQVRTWIEINKSAEKLGIISMLVMLLTGVYMMLIEWGLVAWIVVTLASVVLMIVLMVAVTRPRIALIGQALTIEKGVVSKSFYHLANQPLLWISLQTRVAIALGILFLMLGKLELTGSLITIGVAIVIGLASAFPVLRSERARERMAN